MNWLPSPPTDNLYKFIAIFGLWLLLGLIMVFAWLGYLQFQLEKEGERAQAYFSSKRMEAQISARLASVKARRPAENKLEWMPPDISLEQEQKLIQEMLTDHKQAIEKNKDALDRKFGEELKLLGSMGFPWVMPIYMLFTVSCTLFGFIQWHRKIQKPSEEAHILDCRLKEVEIKKIEAEIRDLRRNYRKALRPSH